MIDTIPSEYQYKAAKKIVMSTNFKKSFHQPPTAIGIQDYFTSQSISCEDHTNIHNVLTALYELATLNEISVIIIDEQKDIRAILNEPTGEFVVCPLFCTLTPSFKIQFIQVTRFTQNVFYIFLGH